MLMSVSPPTSGKPVPTPVRTILSALACVPALILIPRALALGILVPAYFSPAPAAPGGYWSALSQAADRVPLIAIMNPNNGPASWVNSNYTSAVNALRAAGGRVIGYVYTSYTARALTEVKADIDRYHAFYTIDGFFVDEMTSDSDAAHLAYYEELYQYVKAKRSSYFVVGNPGTQTLPGYLTRPTVDALVTFENNTGYPQYVADTWTQTQPATAFSHLCYAVPTADAMTNYVQLALVRNAGYIYVTDDLGSNPWDTLPSYWLAEVGLVEAINRQAASNRPPVLSILSSRATQVNVLGTAGRYVLQASTDFTNWVAVATNVSPTGSFAFSDPQSTNYPARVYRTAQ